MMAATGAINVLEGFARHGERSRLQLLPKWQGIEILHPTEKARRVKIARERNARKQREDAVAKSWPGAGAGGEMNGEMGGEDESQRGHDLP